MCERRQYAECESEERGGGEGGGRPCGRPPCLGVPSSEEVGGVREEDVSFGFVTCVGDLRSREGLSFSF